MTIADLIAKLEKSKHPNKRVVFEARKHHELDYFRYRLEKVQILKDGSCTIKITDAPPKEPPLWAKA